MNYAQFNTKTKAQSLKHHITDALWQALRQGQERVALSSLALSLQLSVEEMAQLRDAEWMYVDQPLHQLRDIPLDCLVHWVVDGEQDYLTFARYGYWRRWLWAWFTQRIETQPPAPLRPSNESDQTHAIAQAAQQSLTLLIGGPGTGKSTTARHILRTYIEQINATSAHTTPLVALTAPTGKAAARLQQAILASTPSSFDSSSDMPALQHVQTSTLHQLLKINPTTQAPAYHAQQVLPHDIVIVDECSMVDLALLVQMCDALKPSARLLLLGDPHQLEAVEVGAIFSDLVAHPAVQPCIARLNTVYRSQPAILHLAQAIQQQDLAAFSAQLSDINTPATQWLASAQLEAYLTTHWRDYVTALQDWQSNPVDLHTSTHHAQAHTLFSTLNQLRLLCSQYEGIQGVHHYNQRCLVWLNEYGWPTQHGLSTRYPDIASYPIGTPIMVTRNNYDQGVMNGEVGIYLPDMQQTPPQPWVYFVDALSQHIHRLRLTELSQPHVSFAMTIHKSQGSEFDHVLIAMEEDDWAHNTALGYTAITRAKHSVTVMESTQIAVPD